MAEKTPAQFATPDETADLRKAQAEEWGTFICGEAPITYNGVLAYNPGTPVPVSNVKRHGYEEQGVVLKVTSKAAQDLIRKLHATTTAEPTETVVPPVSLNVSVPD